MNKNFLDIKIEDIIEWCKDNNQVDWLKNKASETKTVERYSERKKKLDDNGNVVLNKKGFPVYVADKSSKKKEEQVKISFMELKYDFCKEFMPEILPKSKKKKEKTMYDLIAEL